MLGGNADADVAVRLIIVLVLLSLATWGGKKGGH